MVVVVSVLLEGEQARYGVAGEGAGHTQCRNEYSRYSITVLPLSAQFLTELDRDPVVMDTYKSHGYLLCNPFLTELG
jgi:hypothetical protein